MNSVQNFNVRLFDQDGNTVPGSVRKGHNVFTAYGRSELAKLFTWAPLSLTDPDSPNSERRIRWAGVGTGTQPDSLDVIRMANQAEVSSGVYLKEIDTTQITFPTITHLRYRIVFSPSEVIPSPIVLSEAALFMDTSPGGPFAGRFFDVEDNTAPPSFYCTFEPLVKFSGFSMELIWELRF